MFSSKEVHLFDFSVPSGVPQGSVLGPTLFLIYINDMPIHADSLLLQYADDTTILMPISSPASSANLQQHLQAVHNWARTNLLHISSEKRAAMRISHNKAAACPEYFLGDVPLKTALNLPILGVTFSPSLDFSAHIRSTVSKARCGPEVFRALYTALVLARLAYCTSVWSPHQSHLIDKLEGVQCRAMRTLFARTLGRSKPLPGNEDRLKTLK